MSAVGKRVSLLLIVNSSLFVVCYPRLDASHEKTRFMIHSVLDCSGYLGWVLFNLIPNKDGYVMKSGLFPKTLAGFGWGKWHSRNNIKTRIALRYAV